MEQKVTIDGGKSNITINIVIGGNADSASCSSYNNGGNSYNKEVAAAIAAALEMYNSESCDTMEHDKESFVVTIRPYERYASPWGSKAITFRERPPYQGPFSPLKMNPMRFRPEFR